MPTSRAVRRSLAWLALALTVCTLLVDARPAPRPAKGGQSRLVFRPICFVDGPERSSVVARRAGLEAHEFRVAADGAWVVYPEVPAAGYHVTLGGKTAVTAADGSFSLAGSGTGVFSHPTDRLWRASFKAASASPRTYVWPVGFSMKASPMGCCGRAVAERGDRAVAAGGRFHGAATPVAVRRGPRGTYPEPEFPLGCLDDDGPLKSGEPLLDYLGSTCDAYVRAGVCVNEWPSSDREYNALRRITQLAGVLDEGEFLSPPVVPQRRFHCPDNHKGRACQQIQIGDISVDHDGAVTRAGGTATFTVEGGRPCLLTVHNNGSTGETEVMKTRDELGGSISGARPVLHYDAEGESFHYRPDREITYTAPGGKEGTDTYVFQTDGRAVEVSFKAKPAPTPSPASAADGQVIVRLHATLRCQSEAHHERVSEHDQIIFEQDETVVYRVVAVEPTSLVLKEVSSTATCTVSGGGAETGASTRAWTYAPVGTVDHCGTTLDMRSDGHGRVHPAISWMAQWRATGNRGGGAAGVSGNTLQEYLDVVKRPLPFTWTPGIASTVRGKDGHTWARRGPEWHGEGRLTIEYSVSIGRIKRR